MPVKTKDHLISTARGFLLTAALLASGCYEVSRDSDTVVLTFSRTVRILLVAVPGTIVGGCAVVALLLFMRPSLRWLGALPAVAAIGLLGLTGLIVPGIIADTVTITSTSVTQKTGFWFAPHTKGFDYAGTEYVQVIDERMRGRVQKIWRVQHRDGSVQVLDPGDLWSNNDALVIEELRRRGVVFR